MNKSGVTEPVQEEEEKPQGTQNTYLCDQTVGEMADQDFDNFRHIMKNETYIRKFSTRNGPQMAMARAMMYSGHCLDAILKQHGFTMPPPERGVDHSLLVETQLKKLNLRVETRTILPTHPHADVYQTGIYVVKTRAAGEGDLIDHEIVGFVSEPYIHRDPARRRIQELYPPVSVRSTVKL